MKICVALLVSLGLGLCCAPNANAQSTCPPPSTVASMTIKIFNNDPSAYIFPVFTTGGPQKGGSTEVQAWFCKGALSNYATNTNFRFYYNPGNPIGSAGSGIAPGGSVTLKIPLYTSITDNRDFGPYIDWWTGDQIELFFGTSAGPPQAYTDLINGKDPNNPNQTALSFSSTATIPDCVPTCPGLLKFFTDPASIAKANPSQLIEFNLGARQTLAPCVNSQPPNPAGPNTFNPVCLQPRPTNVLNALDTRNVDIDMSYVNVAFAPATLAPFQNDQTGFVGTPQSAETFSTALSNFVSSSQCQPANQTVTSCQGWPQFVHTNPTGSTPANVVINPPKLASPLEVFLRNSPPTNTNPPDLCGFNTVMAPAVPTPPCPNTTGGLQWPNKSNGNVAKLWPPIQVLLDNWISHAGSLKDFADTGATPAGSCGTNPPAGTFCAAIMDVKTLIIRNYINYANLCRGGATVIPLNDFTAIAHVYGWTPFNENCPVGATGNLLQNTPIPGGGSYADNNFALYQQVKLEFDQLNNNSPQLTGGDYNFNPWVNVLIHGPNFVNAPNVYAYSVDDAVGNLQSEGGGFIIDVGSSQNLCSGTTPCGNQNAAGPPVNVQLSLNFTKSTNINFTNYGLCQYVPGDINSDKTINTLATSFVLNPNAPQQCPIFLVDNQNPPQLYTFTISKAPNQTQPPEFVPCQGGTPNCKPTAANTCIDGAGGPTNPPCAGGVAPEGTTQVINCRDQIQKSNGRTCIGASPACDATNSVLGNTPMTTIPPGGGAGSATFQTSSQTWCCVKNAPLNGVPQVNGVWARSQPNPTGDARGKGSSWEHFVTTNVDPTQAPSGPISCSMGQ